MLVTDLSFSLSQLETPMVNWDALASGLDRGEKLELEKELQAIGERALRLARYLDIRANGYPGDHDHAVKAQNQIGRAIRKTLGFSYPAMADVNF